MSDLIAYGSLPRQRSDGFPRRNDLSLMTPLEKQIFDLVQTIETTCGAHYWETRTVVLLGEAREAMANYLEGIPEPLKG